MYIRWIYKDCTVSLDTKRVQSRHTHPAFSIETYFFLLLRDDGQPDYHPDEYLTKSWQVPARVALQVGHRLSRKHPHVSKTTFRSSCGNGDHSTLTCYKTTYREIRFAMKFPPDQNTYLVFWGIFFFTHACKTLVCAPFTDSENGLFSHQCAK